jgi:hypothetical protein
VLRALSRPEHEPLMRSRSLNMREPTSAIEIVFDLTGRQDNLAALATIRRRVDVERLAWRFGVGSP